VTRWQPGLELTRLLEALAEDIIAATDEEVRRMHGRTIASTAREVRLFIGTARADTDESLRKDPGESLSGPGAGSRRPDIHRRPPHHQRH
jgi:hypothetical protein